MSDVGKCAHMDVGWVTASHAGVMITGWWECVACGTVFVPYDSLHAENASLKARVRRLEEAIKRMVLSADQHRDSYGCSEVREIGNAVLLEATDE